MRMPVLPTLTYHVDFTSYLKGTHLAIGKSKVGNTADNSIRLLHCCECCSHVFDNCSDRTNDTLTD